LLLLFATGVNDTGGKFAAGVVETGGNVPPASLTPVANLPPVSTTLAKMVEKFAIGVADTGGKKTRSKKSRGTVPLNKLPNEMICRWQFQLQQ
jgi:hypothetical protein